MIKFSGASDDIVIVDQHGSIQEHTVGYGGGPGCFIVGNALRVHAIFDASDEGTWCFAVDLLRQDAPLPAWPISVEADGYSADLKIDAPADVCVFREARR